MPPRILQIVGYKNSGKTTLACELIRRFSNAGRQVASIKHDVHGFQADQPGTDSWKHREAGASQSIIASPERTAWFAERQVPLDRLIELCGEADLIVIEGYKDAEYPKLVLLRSEEDAALLSLTNIQIVIMGDGGASLNHGYPVFHRDDLHGIYRFLTG